MLTMTSHWTLDSEGEVLGSDGGRAVGGHQAGRSQGVSHEPKQALHRYDQETFQQQFSD